MHGRPGFVYMDLFDLEAKSEDDALCQQTTSMPGDSSQLASEVASYS